jgi:hypothetical protein
MNSLARGIVVLAVGLFLVLTFAPIHAEEEDEGPWMPETLSMFVRAMSMALAENLTPEEMAEVKRWPPDELRVHHPELHEKIQRSYVNWTDEWIRRAKAKLDTVPEKRLIRAEESAARVDSLLRSYFEARGWEYRSLEVIFLPQKLMVEPGLPTSSIRGMYALFYPKAFFATLDPNSRMEKILIHETFHFNKTGPSLGRTLTEGITEAATRRLALKWGMINSHQLRQDNIYPAELKAVEYLQDEIVKRTGKTREEAFEILLHAYLTGDSKEPEAILGPIAWSEVIRASRGGSNVRKAAKRALKD